MRLMVLAITGLMLGVPAAAQDPSPGAPNAAIVQAINDLERRLNSALLERNRAVLETLIANPFMFVHNSTGVVQSREEWLAAAVQGIATGAQRGGRAEHAVTFVAYGGAAPHTVIRTARVVLEDAQRKTEEWLQQVRVFVRGDQGTWRLASVQGTPLYEGPAIDRALHARYAGTYLISPERILTLTWEHETLFARFPNGVRAPLFLASPTEEATRAPRLGSLRFTLGSDGRPVAAALVRDGKEVWRAVRSAQ